MHHCDTCQCVPQKWCPRGILVLAFKFDNRSLMTNVLYFTGRLLSYGQCCYVGQEKVTSLFSRKQSVFLLESVRIISLTLGGKPVTFCLNLYFVTVSIYVWKIFWQSTLLVINIKNHWLQVTSKYQISKKYYCWLWCWNSGIFGEKN